jgi:hypothetical protein
MSPSGLVNPAPATFASSSANGPHTEEEVSIAGAMLLSAMSVLIAIVGMVTFALFVIGCWWLISHVPVPTALQHILARIHLARR